MQEFYVFEKISKNDRAKWHLYIDAVYRANPSAPNLGAEVLSKLLSVGNQGGFRYKGSSDSPKFIALFTSGEDVYWRDELDTSLGLFLYFGDQKTPGKDLHDTKLKGNLILKNTFLRAFSDNPEERKRIPPVFVFKKVRGRDIQFLGLAVPGISGRPEKDWLTAVWGADRDGNRFLNYKSFFTIVNTASGSLAESNNAGINLAWLSDIEEGNAYESKYAPLEWKNYIDKSRFKSLITIREKYVKTKEEQLPPSTDEIKIEMLKEIHRYFYEQDRGYSFEGFACEMVRQLDDNVERIDVTTPYKDGGIDGIGTYKVFSKGTQSVSVEFYMQAKCYSPFEHGLSVKDTSRLISRIKNRQFGILVTTSFIHKQAYEEILEDTHPVVFVTGKTIVDLIYDRFEIRTLESLKRWLQNEF